MRVKNEALEIDLFKAIKNIHEEADNKQTFEEGYNYYEATIGFLIQNVKEKTK